MTKTAQQFEQRVTDAWRAAEEGLNGSDSHMRRLRKAGFAAFESLGLPAPKSEAWKYTPVRKWLAELREPAIAVDRIEASVPGWISDFDGYVAVSVNGVLRPDLSSLPTDDPALTVCDLNEAHRRFPEVVEKHLGAYALDAQESFTALNTAFLPSGFFVRIAAGSACRRPLLMTDIHAGSGQASLRQARALVVAEAGSTGSIVEWYAAGESGGGLENAVTEIFVGAGARLDHAHVYDRGRQASLVNALYAYQDRDSVYSTNHLSLSGSLIRHNLHFLPDAEGCETHLNGLVLAYGDMHVDVHSFVDHAKPNSVSNELYKCILDDEATGVFNGKVMVRQDAQLTNAYQSNRSILLSEKAHMYSKPELEIYADDVKCSHGATTGRLDDEAVFYLRTRGLTEEKARLLLLEAFAADVLNGVASEWARERLSSRVAEILTRNRA